MKTHSFQPYFVAYANAHGRTPEAQLEHDKAQFPGGCMCVFILWIGERKRTFYEATPEHFFDRGTIGNHKAWGSFLAASGKATT
jgi:hypothetical protein